MSIKDAVKSRIKSAKCFEDLVTARRLKSDRELKQWVNDYDNNFSVLRFNELGQLNKDKNVYIMRFDYEEVGFFGYWRNAMVGLAFAERYHLTPVIDWTDKGPYYEKDGVDGIRNPFEYYYEPVSDISTDDAYQSYNVAYFSRNSRGCRDILYTDDMQKADTVRLNQKYMRVRKELKAQIDQQMLALIGDKKTLAVQVRGVEWGKIKNHPIPLSLERYIDEIEIALSEGGFEQIYLATDSEDTIEHLQKIYGDKIVFYHDVVRARKGSKTLAIFDDTIQRENNRYLLGYEVLRDMLTLAHCQGLVASYSNVSLAADITKKSGGAEYEYKKIIEVQLSQKGISANEAVKRMKKGKYN